MTVRNIHHYTKKMMKMKKFGFATVVASSLIAAMLGLAGPAQAGIVTDPVAPHYSVDNQDTVNTTNGFVDDAI